MYHSQADCLRSREVKMDFAEKIQDLARKIEKQKDQINTEQATNTAFVLPFINALGYDIFNPIEVVPEYTADVGIKKGEKVDFAIKKDDQTIMLFECKKYGTNLDNIDISQLYRYFSVVSARIGVLTDGSTYRFYTDLDQPNKMDEKPFLDVNLLDLQPQHINELKKLTKDSFDIDKIVSTASELKYTRQIKIILNEELKNPTDEFIKFFASKVYSGMITQKVKKQFSDITRRAFQQFINDMINIRLKSAMSETTNETEGTDITED